MRARQRHLNPGHLGMACAFDSRFISGLSNNDSVDTWTDRTSNGRNATQATAAKKPTYKTEELNGNPALSFDGGDALVTGSFTASILASAHVVFKASANGLVYERGNAFNDNGNSYIYTSTGYSTQFRGTSASAYSRATDWGLGSTWRLVSHEIDGTHASHKFYINGAVQSMTSGLTANPTGSYSLPLNIGSRNDAAESAITGSIAVVTYGPVLAGSARRRLQNSLGYSFKIACS